MKSSTLFHTASLRVIANTMEKDFGLDELSEEERSIVYAIFLASQEESRLGSHVIIDNFFPATSATRPSIAR